MLRLCWLRICSGGKQYGKSLAVRKRERQPVQVQGVVCTNPGLLRDQSSFIGIEHRTSLPYCYIKPEYTT